ncbi:MAG: MoaD/ThiS family protein [Flavobacterium sp.]|nr:MAG: MoaD/ThiS family protein [Flavobacterium sp.]
MSTNIKYFGLLAEVTSCREESLSISPSTVNELLEVLCDKYPGLKEKDFRVAIDQKLVSEDTPITGGEIALLPPFSGG